MGPGDQAQVVTLVASTFTECAVLLASKDIYLNKDPQVNKAVYWLVDENVATLLGTFPQGSGSVMAHSVFWAVL